jgi:uncharacterized protein YjbI with pentapeptide repeats
MTAQRREDTTNPWYILATLEGEQTASVDFDGKLASTNMLAWNRYICSLLSAEQKQMLLTLNVTIPDQIIPFSDGELTIIKQKFDSRRSGSSIDVLRSDYIDFRWTSFTGNVSFDGYIFHRTVDLSAAMFNKAVSFRGAIFIQGAKFVGTKFRGIALFSNATFINDARFDRAKFCETADFYSTRFSLYPNPLGYTEFIDYEYGYTYKINALSSFEASKFNAVANFQEAKFEAPVSFINAKPLNGTERRGPSRHVRRRKPMFRSIYTSGLSRKWSV